jgi:chromosome partitioning protein
VLAIASRKGGAGKTTVTGHLAVAAELAGCGPVAIVDLDPQGSLAEWWNRREARYPYFVQTKLSRLREDIVAIRRLGIKLLLIDTPPALTNAIRQIIDMVDLVVLPVRPSPHDLRSVGGTLSVIDSLQKPFLFVLSAASPRANITREARAVLAECGEVAAATLHSRVDYAASMVDGRTVLEVSGAKKSSSEINALWGEVAARLQRLEAQERTAQTDYPRLAPAPEAQKLVGGR